MRKIFCSFSVFFTRVHRDVRPKKTSDKWRRDAKSFLGRAKIFGTSPSFLGTNSKFWTASQKCPSQKNCPKNGVTTRPYSFFWEFGTRGLRFPIKYTLYKNSHTHKTIFIYYISSHYKRLYTPPYTYNHLFLCVKIFLHYIFIQSSVPCIPKKDKVTF